MKLMREIPAMELIPRGFGVAWVRWDRDSAVCVPLGLHLVVSWLRAGWLRFRLWRAPDFLVDAQERAFQAGFSSGRETERATATMDLIRRRQEIEADAIHRFIQETLATRPGNNA